MKIQVAKVDVKGLRRGEPQAYANLIKQYGEVSLRIALRYSGNLDDARDICQDTIIKVWRGIDTFRDEFPFQSWYFKVLTNTCKDWKKNVFHRLKSPLAKVENEPDELPKEQVDNMDWIEKMIVRMPRKMRMIFTLHLHEGFTIREIGEIMTISESTIRVQIMKGRRFLRNLYEEKIRGK